MPISWGNKINFSLCANVTGFCRAATSSQQGIQHLQFIIILDVLAQMM